MSAIGSLLFCSLCGDLLPNDKVTSSESRITCVCCGHDNKDTAAKTSTTQTKPSDFPSALRQKLQSSVMAVAKHDINTKAVINEKCDKCGSEEVRYTSVQLRSADEGSTIFYFCDCGHTWSINN